MGEVERRLQVRREGGYVGVDLFLVMLLFLAWRGEGGLEKLWEHARPWALPLAALGGRKRLASSSSMSRGLSAVEFEPLR